MNDKTKIIIIIICVLVTLITSISIVIYRRDYKKKSVFSSNMGRIYQEAINNYESGISYYAKIDGISCESNFESDSINVYISYYIQFDNFGNVIKFYAYDEKYKFEMEKEKISIDDLGFEKITKENVTKRGNFKLSCNGK